MRAKVVAVVLLTHLLPAVSWAGVRTINSASAPALDEAGLIMLGLAAAGTGIAMLRHRRR